MNERQKLNEARYFYSHLTDEAENPERFGYELSAFLGAARSVAQYAYEEVKKTPKQKWYDNRMDGSPILKYFTGLRNTSIHGYPVQPDQNISIDITVSIGVSVELSVFNADGTPDPSRTTRVDTPPVREDPKISNRYTFADWKGPEDVLMLCSKYLDELEQFIKDGQTKGFLTP